MATLDWDEVSGRFSTARSWWVSTSGPGGPHAVPVWGVVVGGVLHFYGEASTVRSRNLLGDPRLVLHLESGAHVLVLHGTAEQGGPCGSYPAIAAAYSAKYTEADDLEYLPDADGMEGALLWTVRPERALAWLLGPSSDWENRRWSAGSP